MTVFMYMHPLRWVILIAGVCLVWFGFAEFGQSSGASSDPVEVDLAGLEEGKAAPDLHLRIGRHHCLYFASAVQYVSGHESDPTPSRPIFWLYSPLVSEQHPYMKQIRELERKHGSLAKVPRSAAWPKLTEFRVLLKSQLYDELDDLPGKRKLYSSVDGMVTNAKEPLEGDERELIRRAFPHLDLEEVLLVEHGRDPVSRLTCIGFIVVGAFICLWTVYGRPRRQTTYR